MASTSPSWTVEPVILNPTFSVKDYSFSQPALKTAEPHRTYSYKGQVNDAL